MKTTVDVFEGFRVLGLAGDPLQVNNLSPNTELANFAWVATNSDKSRKDATRPDCSNILDELSAHLPLRSIGNLLARAKRK